MTTPARAVNDTITNVFHKVDNLGSHPVTGLVQRRVEHRPASESVPFANKNRSSWRNPMAWHHDGLSLEVANTSAGFTYPATAYSAMWDGGSFWDSSQLLIGRDVSMPARLMNKAEISALNKLKDQNIHVGNFLAEGHQTLSMIQSTVKHIAQDVEAFRSRNPSAWKQVLRYQTGNTPKRFWRCIPNSWLELQYGWNPLMNDVMGAASQLAQKSREVGALFSVDGFAKEFSYEDLVVTDGFIGVFKTPYRRYYERRVKVSLWYSLRNPTLALLSSLGLVNPLEIIWEVTKYSFVVDWFLPVSSWLSALTGDLGYDFKSGTRSELTKVSEYRTGDVTPKAYSGYVFQGSGPHLKSTGYNFDRFVYSVSPVPGLYVKNPLSVYHLANATALLAQAFHK